MIRSKLWRPGIIGRNLILQLCIAHAIFFEIFTAPVDVDCWIKKHWQRPCESQPSSGSAHDLHEPITLPLGHSLGFFGYPIEFIESLGRHDIHELRLIPRAPGIPARLYRDDR